MRARQNTPSDSADICSTATVSRDCAMFAASDRVENLVHLGEGREILLDEFEFPSGLLARSLGFRAKVFDACLELVRRMAHFVHPGVGVSLPLADCAQGLRG